MENWAKSGRERVSRLTFGPWHNHALGTARPASVGLVHLHCMNEPTPTVAGLEPVYTTSELASHLGVPVQTLHDLRHAGRGPRGFRVGRELRYRLSEIQTWLAHLEQTDHLAPSQDGAQR